MPNSIACSVQFVDLEILVVKLPLIKYLSNFFISLVELWRTPESSLISMPSNELVNHSFPGRNGEDCPAYVAEGENTKRGVVVIQEWWGLNEIMVKHVDLIAKKGFMVVCPDLYRGKVTTDNEEAGHLMSNLDWKVRGVPGQ